MTHFPLSCFHPCVRWLLDDDRTARGSGLGFEEGVLSSEKRERGGAACTIIVLHSASCEGGCEKTASDCSNFRFYGALLCLLQSLDTSAHPLPSPLFEFDTALTSFETYQVTGFNSPLNSDSHSSKPVVIITELERRTSPLGRPYPVWWKSHMGTQLAWLGSGCPSSHL